MGSGKTRVWRLRASETVLLAVAAGWSALVLPLGVAFAPAYSGVSVDSVTGAQISSTATMVEVNGRWVLWYAFAPLIVIAIVALLLWTCDRVDRDRPAHGVHDARADDDRPLHPAGDGLPDRRVLCPAGGRGAPGASASATAPVTPAR